MKRGDGKTERDHLMMVLDENPPLQRRPAWKTINLVLRYLLPAAGFVYIFYDIDFGRLLYELVKIRWGWVIAAVIFNVVSFACQGIQWKWLLVPVTEISTPRAVESVFAGQFANEVLPLRVGELFKGYLVSRWTSIDFTSTAPAILAVRVLDGVWSVIGVWLAAIFLPVPRGVLIAAFALGLIILLGTLALFYALTHRQKVLTDWAAGRASGGEWLRRIKGLIGILTTGLQRISMTRYLFHAFAFSLLFLFLQILAFWLVMPAFGLQLSFWVGLGVFLIVHFGTILPNAPGNVGVYQFFCVIGLTLFGVDKTSAAGFSLASFFFLKAPLWIIGFLIVTFSGIPLSSMQERVGKLRPEEENLSNGQTPNRV